MLISLILLGSGTPVWAAEPPPSVVVAPVTMRNVTPVNQYIGHVLAIQSVRLVPRVTAFIEQVAVKQGSDVKAGQVLFRLQDAQYVAALQSAEASLASAQAAYANANLVYQRALKLSKPGFESQANLDAAQAARSQDMAKVLSAKASITQAELDLGYCTITAPISGQIGAVAFTRGNLVTPGSGTLATINQLDPIRVVFSVSDSTLVSVKQRDKGDRRKLGESRQVSLILPNGTKFAHTGKIAFIDNQVNSQTGTVSVYADFANPDELLLPGSYVSVETRPEKPKDVLLVPLAAVQSDKSGSFVLRIGPGDKVVQQTIGIGRQIGQDYIVKSGLADGDRVIVEGIQKVKAGEVVSPTMQQKMTAGQVDQADTGQSAAPGG